MSGIVVGAATFLHVLATMVLGGHYLLFGAVYLPGLRRRLRGAALVAAVDELDLATRPWLIAAVAIFAVTGSVLMFLSPRYTGWVGIIENPWAVAVLAKHVVVALVVIGAIVVEMAAFPAAVDVAADDAERARALDRLGLALRAIAAGIIAVLALTVVAQQAT